MKRQMEKIHILCGFESEQFEEGMVKELKNRGYDPVVDARFTKDSVKEFVEKNPDCSVVVLTESIGGKKYTAEELAQLTDKRDVNVIVVLGSRLYGTDYMKTLYMANITGALIQERKKGVTPKQVVNLITERRSRKAAREYYGIENQKLDMGFLDDDTYVEYHNTLSGNGEPILLNYLAICRKMSPQQIADFTKRLPEEELAELKKYEEFYAVLQLLKQVGIDLKIKRPKKVVIGLKTPHRIAINVGSEEAIEKPVKAEEGRESRESIMADTEKNTVVNPDGMSFTTDGGPLQDAASIDDIFAMLDNGVIKDLGTTSEESVDTVKNAIYEDDAKERRIAEEKLMEERAKFEEAKKLHEEEMEALRVRKDEQLREREKELERSREEERRKAEKLQREQEKEISKLKKTIEKQRRYEDDEEEEEVYLSAGSQFSFGFVFLMLAIVLVIVGFLFKDPIMNMLGM